MRVAEAAPAGDAGVPVRPAPVALEAPLALGAAIAPAAPVLAAGAWFKSAPGLLRAGEIVFSENLGDLDDPATCRRLELALDTLLGLDARTPLAVAHDLHPDFHSTRVALQCAVRLGVPALGVQHHHAHVAAVLAEHGIGDAAPVLGLALDGVGLGTDGHAWGGELLRVAGADFARLGHLRPLRLPGGDRAAREPWRMAAALLHATGRGDEIAARFARQPAAAMLAQVLARPALCPPTTSMGRHFDAAAGLLGVCEVMRVEAEAAIALERLAAGAGAGEVDAADWSIDDAGGALELDLHPLLRHLAGVRDAARGAARFHATLIAALADWVRRGAARSGCDAVVLGGGCFHNRLLAAGLGAALAAAGLRVLAAQRLSPGDGGLALGQAWVALHRLRAGN